MPTLKEILEKSMPVAWRPRAGEGLGTYRLSGTPDNFKLPAIDDFSQSHGLPSSLVCRIDSHGPFGSLEGHVPQGLPDGRYINTPCWLDRPRPKINPKIACLHRSRNRALPPVPSARSTDERIVFRAIEALRIVPRGVMPHQERFSRRQACCHSGFSGMRFGPVLFQPGIGLKPLRFLRLPKSLHGLHEVPQSYEWRMAVSDASHSSQCPQETRFDPQVRIPVRRML